MEILTVENVLELLRLDIDRVGGQSEWARQSGVSRMQINRALKGRRMPPAQLCLALGLEWVVVRQIAGGDGKPQPVVVEKRDLLSRLKAEIEKVGSITVWCEKTGFNRAYVSQVLNKRRPASSQLVAALNFSEVLIRVAKSVSKHRPSGRRHPHARWPTT